jgi:DNA-binding transcriptional ArsR family regulator
MSSLLEIAQVVVDPFRASIVKSLQSGSKYIGQIAEEIHSDRSTVAYHLSILEQNNIVCSEYQILVPPHSKGKAARFYSLNVSHYNKVLDDLEKLLPKLKST